MKAVEHMEQIIERGDLLELRAAAREVARRLDMIAELQTSSRFGPPQMVTGAAAFCEKCKHSRCLHVGDPRGTGACSVKRCHCGGFQ